MADAIARPCWCGNADLGPFGGGYARCDRCGTLVTQLPLGREQFAVDDDDRDFYGKHYWLEHQSQELGLPDIFKRARSDLSERNLHWLKAFLRYKLPPGRVVEIGCSHGSFVALLRTAGFDASGVEMSPWVIELARRLFEVPVDRGPVESLGLPPASLDAIVLMDVLEHLDDPRSTVAHCARLLKAGASLLVQTPCFDDATDHAALVASGSPFLDMLIPNEHIYLFSIRSVTALFAQCGLPHVEFLPAMFPAYDMFLCASGRPLVSFDSTAIESALSASTSGRMVQALLDLRERELEAAARMQQLDADHSARGEQIETLTAMLKESEADRAARARQIESLTSDLRASEADRGERAKQIELLTAQLRASDADRAARGKQIEVLTADIRRSESDRAARANQIEALTKWLREAEADRTGRAEQIDSLKKMLGEARAGSSSRRAQLADLAAALEQAKGRQSELTTQLESFRKALSDRELALTNEISHGESLQRSLLESERTVEGGRERIRLLESDIVQHRADGDALSERLRAIEGSVLALLERPLIRLAARLSGAAELDALDEALGKRHE